MISHKYTEGQIKDKCAPLHGSVGLLIKTADAPEATYLSGRQANTLFRNPVVSHLTDATHGEGETLSRAFGTKLKTSETRSA